jgi:hypothetical protein
MSKAMGRRVLAVARLGRSQPAVPLRQRELGGHNQWIRMRQEYRGTAAVQ